MGEFNVNKSDGSLEQTAGMPSEYPATQVMLSDGVTSVEDRVDAHTIDNDYIDISSYIYDGATFNDYTAPSDGYVAFNFSASQDGGIFLKTDTNKHVTAATTKELRQFIYIKKGMQFCFGSTPTIGRFYPIV